MPPEEGGEPPPQPPARERAARNLRRGHYAAAAILVSGGVAIMWGGVFLKEGAGVFSKQDGAVAARHGHVRGAATAAIKVTEGGSHVRWQKEAIDVVVDSSFEDLAGGNVLTRAIDAWRATGAALPSISTQPGEGRQVGYDPGGTNENVVVFAPSGWSKAHGALAVTVLTYENGSGAIVDADLLVNGGGRFFTNFDQDESGDDGDSISIENGTVAESSAPSKGARTSLYDLQNVVTHEVGHFLGLGEDRDDTKATMYISTRPGEIRKRVLTASDSEVINALYSENAANGPVGCGGARLARGDYGSRRNWIGFGLAAVGLWLTGSGRRRRLGRVLLPIAVAMLVLPPDLRAEAPRDGGASTDAEVHVLRAVPRWEHGIIETELTFRITACHVARCPESDQQVAVVGGTLNGVTQIVGPFGVPDAGDRLFVNLRNGRGLLKVLNPLFKP
jgi:hypothetical protein